MDTEKRLGIKKPKAIMLFLQMFLVLFLLGVSIYLLVFVISNNLGGWMIASYILIIVSVLAVVFHGAYGYKKGDRAYRLSVWPFLGAVLVNVMLPNREPFQIALLTILFALTFAFLVKQKDVRFTSCISMSMVAVALIFSIYSAAKANISFLGDISDNWPTYVAMYSSIFVPTVMTVTFALTYNVRNERSLILSPESDSEA